MAWSRIGSVQNADRNIYAGATVWTGTPDTASPRMCQALIELGDGTKNLSGTGGDYKVTVTVGSNVWNGTYETITVGTGVRTALYTQSFMVPANTAITIAVQSPNSGETDVDVNASLFSDSSPSATEITAAVSAITAPSQTATTSGNISIHIGTDFTLAFDIAVPATWAKIYFSIKESDSLADTASIVQLLVTNPANAGTDGLVRLNGSAGTLANGNLTINGGRTQITVFLKAVTTAALSPSTSRTGYVYDFKIVNADGTVPFVSLPGYVTTTKTVTTAIT